jgi:hypothetical protein
VSVATPSLSSWTAVSNESASMSRRASTTPREGRAAGSVEAAFAHELNHPGVGVLGAGHDVFSVSQGNPAALQLPERSSDWKVRSTKSVMTTVCRGLRGPRSRSRFR